MNDYLMKFVIVGDMDTGKTSLLKNNQLPSFPTIGVDFSSIILKIFNKKCKIHIWDTSGNPIFSNLNQTYYNISVGVIIVFNLSNISSFHNIDFWYKEIFKNNNNYRNFAIIGTHADKIRQVPLDIIEKKCREINADYFEVPSECCTESILKRMAENILNDYNNYPSNFYNLPGFKDESPQTYKINQTSDYVKFNDNDEKEPCCRNCTIQ